MKFILNIIVPIIIALIVCPVVVLVISKSASKEVRAKRIAYPRIVHNSCTNQWAVIDTILNPYGDNHYVGQWYLADASLWTLTPYHDTLPCGYLGDELTFPDSLTALQCYQRYKNKRHVLKITDSLTRVIKDSIFKCQHTYN